MNDQQLQQQFQAFEQRIMQIQEQQRAIEQAILDMNTIAIGLDELVGKEGEEIMAPIGRGIFVKAKLLSEELVVDVGGHNFVKKPIPETKKLILDQVEKLKVPKEELEKELEKINNEITQTMQKHQAAKAGIEDSKEQQ